ncbi:MAG: hypothetical protein QM757_21370, partial [Paludibaculum sp.]
MSTATRPLVQAPIPRHQTPQAVAPVRRDSPVPLVHVQRIVSPANPSEAVPREPNPPVEIREKRMVEERVVVREVEHSSGAMEAGRGSESWMQAVEMPAQEMAPAPQPVSHAQRDYSRLPAKVELPEAGARLSSETRREVEREVTRIVRERVRSAALPKT